MSKFPPQCTLPIHDVPFEDALHYVEQARQTLLNCHPCTCISREGAMMFQGLFVLILIVIFIAFLARRHMNTSSFWLPMSCLYLIGIPLFYNTNGTDPTQDFHTCSWSCFIGVAFLIIVPVLILGVGTL